MGAKSTSLKIILSQGRTEETYGEDPFLNSRMAVAMVTGMQGSSLSLNSSVIAEPKHFAVHSIPEV